MPVEDTPSAAVPPDADALAAVLGFATAWARPDLSTEQWATEIQPWCTPRFGALLSHVSPARIPARQITGKPTLTAQEPAARTYSVATDTGTLAVTVIPHDGRWKVHNREFTSDNGATAPLVKPS